MGTQGQLRVLTIEIDKFEESVLYRLGKGWTLHFDLGSSLADKEVHLYVNHPERAKDGSDRNKYRELVWHSYSEHCIDMFDKYAAVPLVLAGSFNYYFTIGKSPEKRGCGTFLVDPVLHIGKLDERLSLDSVTCQTVLTKSLGPFKDWEARLKVSHECGYNMIHFTPIQELGASQSSYCISDQHALNPNFNDSSGKHTTMLEVQDLVNRMQTEWGVLSLVDLVFNHTANESAWIQKHPEAVYNVVNSPHLKPAYILDRALYHFNLEVSHGKWQDKGIPSTITHEDHLKAIHWHFLHTVLPPLKIEEFYLMNIDDVVQQFSNAFEGAKKNGATVKDVCIVNDPKFRRRKSTVDISNAVQKYNIEKPGLSDANRKAECCAAFRQHLETLNAEMHNEINCHLEAAVNNIIANARYRFLEPSGPKIGKVTEKEPLMFHYFMPRKDVYNIAKEEELMNTEAWGSFCMVHNGWVMGDDPLRNFAEPGSNVYLRRELIPWGDSVKLRYGTCPEDSPYLWEHMRQYTVNAAKVFHGIRLDNCHSTPIHVAEYMLDEARKVRPDLYIIAELFTSSEQKDNIFINRLGLTALIREGLNAWDAHELGRLVHRFGGLPVGAFIQPQARPLLPSGANAIFFDQTHDNPSPIEKRSVYDLLPSAALIAMSCCATGSNRGYDELVPHHIHVVDEKRFYRSWNTNTKAGAGFVNQKTGISVAKCALNKLHAQLSAGGFEQVYVDQVNKDIVSVTRHNPVSHQSVILVSRTAFQHPQNDETGYIPPLVIPGDIEEIIVEGRLISKNSAIAIQNYKRDEQFINGVSGYNLIVQEHIKVSDSSMIDMREIRGADDVQEVNFCNFPPGSILAIRVNLKQPIKAAVLKLRGHLSQFGFRMHTYSGRSLQQMTTNELETIVTRFSLNDINRVLFRCDQEERDDGNGGAVYDIPDYGKLNFCGLHGMLALLNKLRSSNNLGHPLCDNLRNGDWMPTYIYNRLLQYPTTKPLGQWFERVFTDLACVPRYLIPCYFDAIIRGVYQIVEEVACAKMSPFVQNGPSVIRRLAMGSAMFCSFVRTGCLPRLSPNLLQPHPESYLVTSNGTSNGTQQKIQCCSTLCAGLPHFSAGIWRNWGRDTFIALPGLLLVTGRFTDARFLILGYAATLRHGLIPNLLGDGVAARYNCRDAVWWWLQSIKLYCQSAPEGYKILQDDVSRLYPTDDAMPNKPGETIQPLSLVIQEALQRHADGLKFRERNAGPKIDEHMKDEGFNNVIGVDWQTGFVFGGNQYNCGTWMDKMGSSATAGNKGVPATPRDGSAIELVGLCKSVVSWLAHIHKQGHYPYEGVHVLKNGENDEVTFSAWSQLIQNNFHRYFWVSDTTSSVERRPDLINRQNIYKDCYGATQEWTDYQLRSNFPVTIVVAPELFAANPECAEKALNLAAKHLMGPLGMKTLDPSDFNYRADYHNSDQSSDFNTAQGFNYHQGPEWLWPVGYFLRAKLLIAGMLEKSHPGTVDATISYVHSTLCHHNSHIQCNDWNSLPELTNSGGKVCNDSCVAQAWSVGCILEVLDDLKNLKQA